MSFFIYISCLAFRKERKDSKEITRYTPFRRFLLRIPRWLFAPLYKHTRVYAHIVHYGVENAFTSRHLLITPERGEYWWQCLDEKLLLGRHCPRNYRSRNDYWLATTLITTTSSGSVHCRLGTRRAGLLIRFSSLRSVLTEVMDGTERTSAPL